MPLRFRGAADTQLSGALIVDPPDSTPDGDRVFVITDWTSLTRTELKELAAAEDPGVTFFRLDPRYTFLVNGLSWPATERLTYRLGEDVRWRVVNLSSQAHPMHLHGFYYQVDGLGDGLRETAFGEGNKPRVVTQLVQPGATLEMTWQPERIGNWIFHCHIVDHASPARALDGAKSENGHAHHASNGSVGMAGLVLGVTVVDPDGTEIDYRERIGVPTRRLTLRMESEAKRYGTEPAFGFVLVDDGAVAAGGVPVPGPTLALSRGQPVEITLENLLPEATSIHWHGMELESFYDGVHGWSGVGRRVTPLIDPGGSFVARFTPPRAGTFIYHTHLHDSRQLTSGLYGPMVVLESGETFDPATDHPILIGRGGPLKGAPAVVNGTQYPQLVWKAGARHRIRLINITPDDIFVVSLQTADGPVRWQPLAKDGMPVGAGQGVSKPATQTIAVGETYDFEFQAPPGRQNLWINVRTPAGKWEAQAHVIVR
jgi:FtsP/CotA-like multicopper oxidase with cupredoxin domain